MSVVIPGMDMPKNCEECEFHLTEDIAFELIHQCQINRGYIDNADIHGFPHACPLVELPKKHGRLFDLNEVKKVLNDLPDSEDKWSAIALLEWAIEKRWCIEAEDEG